MNHRGCDDKITLGIPVYNAADLIERSLLSALNQTYPHIEYILVDDKGNSMDIVHKVLREHPRGKEVRIIDQKQNRGIGASRNAILDAATGTYLFTMDCDDTIVPDCIERLYAGMCQYRVDFVAASFVREDKAGRQYGGCHYPLTWLQGEPGSHPVATYRYKEGNEVAVPTWNKLYDVAFLRRHRIRCKEGHWNEDPWFTYQVLLCANSCLLLPDVTLHYMCNPLSVSEQSASRGYSEQIARQYVDIQKLKSHYITSLVNDHLYHSLLLDIMKMSLYHSYRILDSSCLVPEVQRELVRSLLTLETDTPKQGAGARTWRYEVLRLFFSLPMGLKMACIRGMVNLNVKQRARRWIHF